MKYLNKFVSALFVATLGIMTLASCEGADLYKINAPDWLSEKGGDEDEPEPEEELVGQMEDVYNIGKEDLSSGFWTLGKTYVVPAGAKWQAQFNLTVNPDNKYFKNFYIVLNACTNAETGELGAEYGVIRYDNDPSKNSEWNTTGTEIDRSLVGGNFTNSSPTEGDNQDVDASVQKMNGKITLTVDRTDGGLFIKMTNGTLTKTYTQTTSFPSTGADVPLACRIGVEASLVSFISTNIEPIGGCTSANDKQPLSMELTGVPTEVLVGTDLAEAMANVTAVVTFEEGVTATVTAKDLQFEAIPNMEDLGQKTLVVIYNKTFKGANADRPIMASKTFSVVKELSAFTQTVVVPTPLVLGAEDNSTGWWGAHTENIKVEPKETKVTSFTNHTSGVANWNNFVIVLCKASNAEYAVVRADNYGWGDGYAACTPIGGFADDDAWAAWRADMEGAKVTTYVTNNGDGTADVKAVMVGNSGNVYQQEYKGINTVDPDDFYFRFTVDGCHLVFDQEVGAPDCSTGWWGAHSTNIQVIGHQECTVNFTNYSSCANNWNNFVIVLCKADNTEYAVVRADNYGWGDGYAACTPSMENGRDWDVWRPAMNGAKVSAKIVNNGDGTADIKVVMHGNNGVDYTQDYIGINTIDPDNFYFRFTVDSSYLVFE
jgi:hypothetical protein